jgi:pimeloyl-ACP methyl ester carboxylesterase
MSSAKNAIRLAGCTLVALTAVIIIFLAINYRSEIPASELEPDYFTAESSYLPVDDANLHVRMRGKGEPILLIHGSFSSLHTWEAFENELLKHTFRTISVDLPGHGLTGPNQNQNYSTDYYAQLIFSLADSLGLDSFSVVGNSMGGNVAMKMALLNSQRIKSLILIDAAAFSHISEPEKNSNDTPFIFRMLQIKPVAALLTRITPRFLFKMNLKEVYGNQEMFTDKELDRYYYLLRRAGNRAATLKRLQYPGSDIQNRLQDINTPTLILWGEKDRWIPLPQAYQLHQAIDGSKLIVFTNAGHIPMEEMPQATADSAISFLQKKLLARR